MKADFSEQSTSPSPSSKHNKVLISASVKSIYTAQPNTQSNSIPFIKNDSNCNFIDKIIGNISCFDTVPDLDASLLIIPGLYLFDSPKDKAIRLHSNLNKTENLQKCLESIPTKQLEQLKSVSRIVFHKPTKSIGIKDVEEMVQIGGNSAQLALEEKRFNDDDENENENENSKSKTNKNEGRSNPIKNEHTQNSSQKENVGLTKANELIESSIKKNMDAIVKSNKSSSQSSQKAPSDRSIEKCLEKISEIMDEKVTKMESIKIKIDHITSTVLDSKKHKNVIETNLVEPEIQNKKCITSNKPSNQQLNKEIESRLRQMHKNKQQENVLLFENSQCLNQNKNQNETPYKKLYETSTRLNNMNSHPKIKQVQHVHQHNKQELQKYYEKFSETYKKLLIQSSENEILAQQIDYKSFSKSFEHRPNDRKNEMTSNEKKSSIYEKNPAFSKSFDSRLNDRRDEFSSNEKESSLSEKNPPLKKSLDQGLNNRTNKILQTENRRLSLNENSLVRNFSTQIERESGNRAQYEMPSINQQMAVSNMRVEDILRENLSKEQSKPLPLLHQNKNEILTKIMPNQGDKALSVLAGRRMNEHNEKILTKKFQIKPHENRGKVIVIPYNNTEVSNLKNPMQISQNNEQAAIWRKSAEATQLINFGGVKYQKPKVEANPSSTNTSSDSLSKETEKEARLKSKLVEALRNEVLQNKIDLLKDKLQKLNASSLNQCEINNNSTNGLIRSSTPLSKSNTISFFPIAEHTFPCANSFPTRGKSDYSISPGISLNGLDNVGNSLKFYIKEKTKLINVDTSNKLQIKQNQIVMNESKRRNTEPLPAKLMKPSSAFRKYSVKNELTDDTKEKQSKQIQYQETDSGLEKSNSNLTIKSILKKTTKNVGFEMDVKNKVNEQKSVDKLSQAYFLMDKLLIKNTGISTQR